MKARGILVHARERENSGAIRPAGKIPHEAWTKTRSTRLEFVNVLREAKVNLIVLAGFMRVLKGDFLRAFEGRIVNVHPSLLPVVSRTRKRGNRRWITA